MGKRIRVTNKDRLAQILYSGISEQTLELIDQYSPLLRTHSEEIVERLYREVYEVQKLREIIDQYSTLERLKVTQKGYFERILHAIIDDEYIHHRFEVGRVHSRIGLPLTWYIASFSKYLHIISEVIMREVRSVDQLPLILAMQSIFNLDSQITLDSYSQVELDRATRPLRYELEKIRNVIGLSDDDLNSIHEFSGFISFRARKIIDLFINKMLQRSDNKWNVIFSNDELFQSAYNILVQFFQDKIYLDTESYYRIVRDWSRYVLDGDISEQVFYTGGECLIEAIREIFLSEEYENDIHMKRYVPSFERLVRFTRTLIDEILKPYLLLRDFQFLDIYAYEVSTIDFGRLTWLEDRMRKHIKDRGRTEEVIGRRCYEVLYKRNFPCNDCPVLNKTDHAALLIEEHDGKHYYYKARQLPQNEIFNLSRALIVVQDTTQEGKVLFDTVERLLQLAEFRDDDTGQHVFRIGLLAEELARLAGCEESFVKQIGIAAKYHDIGKVGIPDSILNKPSRLTPEERESMKTHTDIGHQILANLELPVIQMAAKVAQTHHEWWNGNGYPYGLKEEEIPLEGRIVAIVDVFDALLSKRAYKDALPQETVKEIMLEGRGTQFDPRLVDLFLKMWDEFLRIRHISY
ncbi:MAG TPA: protoglobin domain-containing protein [Bacillota bacterium]|nr:protoglobin domain-containing protein [Bacillota bacterium]